MTGGLGRSDGITLLKGRVEGGVLVGLIDHSGNDLGMPMVSSVDPATGGTMIKGQENHALGVARARSATQLAAAPSALDKSLSAETIFYDVGDPTKRYSMNAAKTAFVALGSGNNFGYVSVKDAPYNAVGDGVADDTAAVRAAILSGKSVFFPRGTYKITSNIQMTQSNIVIFGDRATILVPTAICPLLCDQNDVSNIWIRGLIFNCTAVAPAAPRSSFIYFIDRNCNRIKVTDCEFYAPSAPMNAMAIGIVGAGANASVSKMTEITFSNNYCATAGPGIEVLSQINDAVVRVNGVTISNNRFVDHGAYFSSLLFGLGISLSGTVVNATIANNLISGCTFAGIEIVTQQSYYADITVIGNVLRNCNAGFSVNSSAAGYELSGVNIVGNVELDSTNGNAFTRLENCRIVGNTFKTTVAASPTYRPWRLYYLNRCTLSGNHWETNFQGGDNVKNGIEFANSNKCTVIGNTFRSPYRPLWITGATADNIFTGNTIECPTAGDTPVMIVGPSVLRNYFEHTILAQTPSELVWTGSMPTNHQNVDVSRHIDPTVGINTGDIFSLALAGSAAVDWRPRVRIPPVLRFYGAPTATIVLTLPAVERALRIINDTTQTITLTTATGSNLDIAAGTQKSVRIDRIAGVSAG